MIMDAEGLKSISTDDLTLLIFARVLRLLEQIQENTTLYNSTISPTKIDMLCDELERRVLGPV